jgi:hypothetical protein
MPSIEVGAVAAKPSGNDHRLIIIGADRSARHRNLLLSVGLFSNDQSSKHSDLRIRRLHAVRPRDRIFRRTGVIEART